MTIEQKLNLKNITFDEKLYKLIEYIGLDNIIPYIPVTKEVIKKALCNNDYHLNTISISIWDKAAGFCVKGIDVTKLPVGVYKLLINCGINCFSVSECVSLLKHAAIMYTNNY